jgi:peptidoglycan/LPS O-acetylase OafA/YrhL
MEAAGHHGDIAIVGLNPQGIREVISLTQRHPAPEVEAMGLGHRGSAGSHRHDTIVDAISALLFVQNYRYAFFHVDDSPLGHTWSLSLEEQFYLIWPFILMGALARWQRQGALYVALGLVALVALWRVFVLLANPDHAFTRIYFSLDTRGDGLFIGCALALWTNRPELSSSRLLKLTGPAILLCLWLVVTKLSVRSPLAMAGYPLFDLAAVYLILAVTDKQSNLLGWLLSLPPLVALGRISYGFYLWHYMIIHELRGPWIGGTMIGDHRTSVAFALSVAAAAISYWFVERHILRIKFARFETPAPQRQS